MARSVTTGRQITLFVTLLLLPAQVTWLATGMFPKPTLLSTVTSVTTSIFVLRSFYGLWLGNQRERLSLTVWLAIQAAPGFFHIVTITRLASGIPGVTVAAVFDVVWQTTPMRLVLVATNLTCIALLRLCPQVKKFVDSQLIDGHGLNLLPMWGRFRLRSVLGAPGIYEAMAHEVFRDRADVVYEDFPNELIAVMEDEELEDAIVTYVSNFVEEHDATSSLNELLTRLPKGLSAVYLLWWVRAEVESGGFLQLFVNEGVGWGVAALDACELVGRPDVAACIEDAIRTYLEEKGQIEQLRADTASWDTIQPTVFDEYSKQAQQTALRDSDLKFFDLPPVDLPAFIRANPKLVQR